MRVRLLACASALALLPVLAATPSLAQTTTGHPPSTPQRFAPGGSAGEGNITPSGDMTWHPPGAGARSTASGADTAPGSAGGTAVGPTGVLTAPGADTTAREVAQDNTQDNTKAAAGSGAELGQAPGGSGQSSTDQSSSSKSSSDQSQSTQNGTSSGQDQGTQGQSNPGQSAQSQNTQGLSPSSQQIEQRTDQRISDLHNQLQITQAEEPKWQAFAQAMKKNAQELAQFWQKNGPRTHEMNAVEGLQFYAQMTLLYAQGAERLVQPFQALYQSMPKHQQELADRVFQQVRAQAAARRRGTRPSNASQQGGGTQSSGTQH